VRHMLNSLKHLMTAGFQRLHSVMTRWTNPLSTSLMFATVTDLFRSKSQLVAENALLGQQLIILRRQVKRPACTRADRMVLVLLARAVQTWKQVLFIVQPETLLRWHRVGFRWFWKRKSKGTSPTPKLAPEIIILIKERAKNNQLWGAERIRGELLKLDMRVCKRTIQK
jgi:putative transposase